MSPNLRTDYTLTRPHEVYVSDITYLPLLGGGWAYLATWLDLYTRRIVGWAVADKMAADLVRLTPRPSTVGQHRAACSCLVIVAGSTWTPTCAHYSRLMAVNKV